MPISMQGPWQLSIVSKNAAFQQRVVVEVGEGRQIHDGTPGTTFDVHAPTWSVDIEHSADGKTWQRSAVRIGGLAQTAEDRVTLTLLSNDGGGDQDYDDLIVECVTTLASHEHLVYGRVRAHQGCLFGCGPAKQLIIDSWAALEQVRRYAAGTKVLARLDMPTRLRPQLDQPVMKPLVIPLESQGPASPVIDANELRTLVNLRDLFHRRCKVRPLVEQIVSFYEYDRTSAEQLGAPYTGEGTRALLGRTTTDERGTYVFRFTRTLGDVIEELFNDLGGGDPNVALRPDLIAVVLDGSMTPIYETAPHYDIGHVLRFDICVPDAQVPPVVELDPNARYIQRIGDINLLSATLGPDGMITNPTPAAGAGPRIVREAAWSGTLRISAMFPSQTARYALRTRTRDGANRGPWRWIQDGFTRYSITAGDDLPIGPTPVTVTNPDQPGQAANIPTYINIYGDPSWQQPAATERAYLHTPTLRSTAGVVELQVFAWDDAGGLLGSDQLELYIDDRKLEGSIESVSVNGSAPTEDHECPLLELPANNGAASLRVDFELSDPGGLLDHWSIQVHRGKNNYMNGASATVSNGFGGPTSCDIGPGSTHPTWLPGNHSLCAFSFTLYAQSRRTDGRVVHGPHLLWRELVAIHQS